MKSKSGKLKLTIELVPRTSWYDNLRKYTSKGDWDKIRERTYGKYRHRCHICGTEGRLNFHEMWEYDDKKHVQRLVGFIPLCNMCHHVKHMGLTGILASEGKLDCEKVVEHFMKVNKCDKKTFEEHKRRAFDEWQKRSRHEWHVNLGQYRGVIKENKRVKKETAG
jgi:hypothetical protein